MDESRFGRLSIQRRCLTMRGVKPLVPYQHRFANFYLFGAYAPSNGDHLTLELPRCNADWFQEWLNQFSIYRPEEFKIVVLDNGAFHKAQHLVIPRNIRLLFLPPYTPELNPAEQIWHWIKDRLGNQIFKTLDDMAMASSEILSSMTAAVIRSITGRELYANINILVV